MENWRKDPWQMTKEEWEKATSEEVFTKMRRDKGLAAVVSYKGFMDYGIEDKWIPDKLKSGKLSEKKGHYDRNKHPLIVQKALSEGKSVLPKVLKEYAVAKG